MSIPMTLEPLLKTLPSTVTILDGNIDTRHLDEAHHSLTIDAMAVARDARFDFSTLAALATKTPSSIRFIVPKNYHATVPLSIMHAALTKPLHADIHIELGEGAQLTILWLHHASSNHDMSIRTSILLGKNAHLNMVSVSSADGVGVNASMQRVHLEQDSSLTFVGGAFTHGASHHDTEVRLAGTGAEADVSLVAFTNKTQDALVHSRLVHNAPHTRGNLTHAGVASDQSTLLFEGVGHIHKGMVKSQAYQSNRGVVLGHDARLDANPLLLIDEHDVEASHGAAIGRIDETQLYYMMSRGLSQPEAERLIIQGYLAPLKKMIDASALHAYYDALIHEKTK